tara:strand:+ start:12277 stop:12771 length:495 start_codon:yes stop_codon:yes gene_type:complete
MASSTKTINHSTSGGSWSVQCAEFVFDWTQVGTHTVAAGAYDLIGQIKLPANSYVFDTQVHAEALWVSGGAVSIIVGDSDDDDGYHASTNLKATDLLVGESNTVEHPGGKAGAYTASEARQFYRSGARDIIAKVTVAAHATAVSAGKTRVLVMYACPPVDSVTP